MSQPARPNFYLIVAGLATIYLVWGSTYLAIRIAVETMPPLLMGGTRFLVAGVVVAGVIAVIRGFRLTRRQWFDNAIVAAFMLLGGNGLVAWAEKTVPSGIATLIVAMNPLFFVLAEWVVAWWRRDASIGARPTTMTFVGLAVGTLGLGILVGPSLLESGPEQLQPMPVIAIICACLCWTIGSLYSRYSRDAAEPFTGSAAQMLCGGVWLIVVGLIVGEHRAFDWSHVSHASLYAWLYLVIAGSLIAFTTFVWLMKHSSPTIVSTYAYVNPIVAVYLGWLILNEPVNPRIFLASATIVLGVALITVSKQLQAARSQKKALA
jgi:drug/metabolite transporter (DMT)-like permease